MKRICSAVHQGLSVLILIGVIVEFFLAGTGIFHATTFQIHRVTGVLLWAGSALLILFALMGRTGRKTIGFSVLLFVLLFIQPLLLQINQPFVEALHPLNALAIMATSAYLVRLKGLRTQDKGVKHMG